MQVPVLPLLILLTTTTTTTTTSQLPLNPTVPPFPHAVHHHPGAYFPGFPVPSFINPPDLPHRIVNQMEYYFSKENLVHDTYLRRQMDAQGWVSLDVVANFRLMRRMTNDIQFIKDSIRANSTLLEIKDDTIRRKHGWAEWPLQPLQRRLG